MTEKSTDEKRLDARLKVAEVELVDEDQGLYEVFVPGAVREVTRVTAESEEEAKEKVRALLANKQQHYASKPVPTGTDQELEIKKAEQAAAAQDAEVDRG